MRFILFAMLLSIVTYADIWNELVHMRYPLQQMYCLEDAAGNPRQCWMPLDADWQAWAYIWIDDQENINIERVSADCGAEGCG